MGSDRHGGVDDRVDALTVGRPDQMLTALPTGSDRSDRLERVGAGGRGADGASCDAAAVRRAGSDWRAGLEGWYHDDPDDIFVAEPAPEPLRPRRMALDEEVVDGRTAREILEGFDPRRVRRAVLGPDTPAGADPDPDADPDLPGLPCLDGQERCVRRVFAAFVGSGFHGAERHEGGLDDRDHLLRLVERQDPAQPDPERRARGIDAFKKGNGKHVCAESSTSIGDPVAYAVALVRGIEHPRVRAALDARHDPPRRPYYVHVPIVELLGESGAEFCWGHQLVGEDPRAAVKERDVWAKAGWKGKPRDQLRQPRTERITSFHDGVVEFRIGHNATGDGYALVSMFPRPRRDQPEGDDPP